MKERESEKKIDLRERWGWGVGGVCASSQWAILSRDVLRTNSNVCTLLCIDYFWESNGMLKIMRYTIKCFMLKGKFKFCYHKILIVFNKNFHMEWNSVHPLDRCIRLLFLSDIYFEKNKWYLWLGMMNIDIGISAFMPTLHSVSFQHCMIIRSNHT